MTVRRFIASGFGVGFIPRRLWGSDSGAGTFGAGLAALASLAVGWRPWWLHVGMFAIAMGLSVWASEPFSDDGADPGWIVIDEIAGTLVALIGLTGWPWLVALVVARAGDITKALPGVAAAERLHGPWGITMDDVIAGLYGLAAGWAVYAVIG